MMTLTALQAMTAWKTSDTLTAIGAVVSIFAILVAVWIYRRQNPKRRMKYTIESIPILKGHTWAKVPSVELRVNNSVVQNPHVVTVTAWSDSRADVSNNNFNANKSIEFDLNTEILYEADAPSRVREGQELNLRREGGKVFIDPCLIKPKDKVQASYICDGDPKAIIKSQLIDIDFVEVESIAGASVRWRDMAITLMGALPVLMAGLIALITGSSHLRV